MTDAINQQAEDGHLDCELKAEMVLADFKQETKFNWPPKKMTQHLNAYCQFADHLQCLNPVSITHKQKDGERWIKRDENSYRYRCYTLFHSFSSIRSFIILYPVFLHFKCKSVTEVLNMYITL